MFTTIIIGLLHWHFGSGNAAGIWSVGVIDDGRYHRIEVGWTDCQRQYFVGPNQDDRRYLLWLPDKSYRWREPGASSFTWEPHNCPATIS